MELLYNSLSILNQTRPSKQQNSRRIGLHPNVLLKENAFSYMKKKKTFFFLSIFHLYHQNELVKIIFDDRLQIPFKINSHKQSENRNIISYSILLVFLI
jgi:hypothetical protein